MLEGFLVYLRNQGFSISVEQWLTLMRGLEQGLHRASLTGFYQLCQSVLLTSETQMDPFRKAFQGYFSSLEEERQPSRELLDWLRNPERIEGRCDPLQLLENRDISPQQAQELFQERLKEQTSQHNGGSYWIGTQGMSPFGRDGNSLRGIQVAGAGEFQRGFQAIGREEYADFRQDRVLNLRQFQLAFRRLRQLSAQQETSWELDVEGTIRRTCDQDGLLKIVHAKPRKNTIKLLVFIDSGGSMDSHRGLCATLFQAVSRANHFQDLRIYYFHNCVYGHLYTTPACSLKHWVDTKKTLEALSPDYKVLFLGDATMDPTELLGSRYYAHMARGGSGGLEWLLYIRNRFKKSAWILPQAMTLPEGSYWRESYDIISNIFPMFSMTIEDLEKAFRFLMEPV